MAGKDGWLFLDNDTNMVVKQHTGELLLTPGELQHWQLILENRTSWTERLGAGYWCLVPRTRTRCMPRRCPTTFRCPRRAP